MTAPPPIFCLFLAFLKSLSDILSSNGTDFYQLLTLLIHFT